MEDRSLEEVISGFTQAAGILQGNDATSQRPPLPPPLTSASRPPIPMLLPPPPPPIRPVPTMPMPAPLMPTLPPLPGMMPVPPMDPMGNAMAAGYQHVAYNTPQGTGFAGAARLHTLSNAPPPLPPPLPPLPMAQGGGRAGHGGVDPLLPIQSMYRVPTFGSFNRAYDASMYNASAIRQLQMGGDIAYQQHAGRAMLAAGGAIAGMGVGGLVGGYFGPSGAMAGMQIGEFAGGMLGMSDTAANMVGHMARPAIERRMEAMQLQGASQNFVFGGTQLDAFGRGLSSRGAQTLQTQLRSQAANSGGQLNQADLAGIMSVSGDLGLLKDAQTADQIARAMKDITSVLGTFAKITGDPDFRNNLDKIAQIKRYGFSISQSAGVMKDLDAFARSSGQSIEQLMSGAGASGAAMFQGAGLTAGGGLRAGAMASMQTRMASSAGSYNDIQKALYGGETGMTQALTSSQAAFISGPGQALLPYVTKRGRNGIEIDQDAVKRLSLGQVSYEDAVKEGSARVAGDSGYMQEMLFKQRELLADFDQKTGPMGTQSMIFAQARKMSETTGMDMSTAMSSIVGRDNAQVMLTAAKDPEYWQNLLRQQTGELKRRQMEAGEGNRFSNRGRMGELFNAATFGIFDDPDSLGLYDRTARWMANGDEDAQLAAVNQRRSRFGMAMSVSRVGIENKERLMFGRRTDGPQGWRYQTEAGVRRSDGILGEDFAIGMDTLAGEDAYLLDTFGENNGYRLGLGVLEDAAKYTMSGQTYGQRQAEVSGARDMQSAYLGARTRSGDASVTRAKDLVASLMAQGLSEKDANIAASKLSGKIGAQLDRNLRGIDRTMSKQQLTALVAGEVGQGVAGALMADPSSSANLIGLGASRAMLQGDLEAQLDTLDAGAADVRLDGSAASVGLAQKRYEEVLREQGMLDSGLFGSKYLQGTVDDMTDTQKKVETAIRGNYTLGDMRALSLYAMKDANKDISSLTDSGQLSMEDREKLLARGEEIMRGEFGDDEGARDALRKMARTQYDSMGGNLSVAGIDSANERRIAAGDAYAKAQTTAQLSELSNSIGLGGINSMQEFAGKISRLRKGSAGYKSAVDRMGQAAVDQIQSVGGKGGVMSSEDLDVVEAATRQLVDPGAEGVTTSTKSYSEAFNKDIRTQKDMIEVTRAVAASFGDSSKTFSDAVDKFATMTGSSAADGNQLRGDQAAVYGWAGMLATTGLGLPAAAVIAGANYFFND